MDSDSSCYSDSDNELSPIKNEETDTNILIEEENNDDIPDEINENISIEEENNTSSEEYDEEYLEQERLEMEAIRNYQRKLLEKNDSDENNKLGYYQKKKEEKIIPQEKKKVKVKKPQKKVYNLEEFKKFGDKPKVSKWVSKRMQSKKHINIKPAVKKRHFNPRPYVDENNTKKISKSLKYLKSDFPTLK